MTLPYGCSAINFRLSRFTAELPIVHPQSGGQPAPGTDYLQCSRSKRAFLPQIAHFLNDWYCLLF